MKKEFVLNETDLCTAMYEFLVKRKQIPPDYIDMQVTVLRIDNTTTARVRASKS